MLLNKTMATPSPLTSEVRSPIVSRQYRIANIERLRILSAFGVASFHAHDWFPRSFGIIGFIVLLLSFCAFVVNRPEPYEFRDLVKRKAERLLKPWLFWSAVYGALGLVKVIRMGVPFSDVFSATMFLTGTRIHLWFLPFAFVAALLLVLAHRRVTKAPEIYNIASAVFVGVVCVLGCSIAQVRVSLQTPLPQWTLGLPAIPLGFARKGWLHRLRRGVYAIVPLSSRSGRTVVEDPLALAMELFSPCYISGWTAAQHWDLTEQIFNAVVVYSARPQRRAEQVAGGVTYRVRRIPERAIFGTTRIWSGAVAVQMASVHRTVIDVLDAPQMGGGGRQTLDIAEAYWKRPDADADVLFDLARRLGRGAVFKRLGFTAERFGRPADAWMALCREHMSAGVSLLDPAGPRRGPIVSRWRLRMNADRAMRGADTAMSAFALAGHLTAGQISKANTAGNVTGPSADPLQRWTSMPRSAKTDRTRTQQLEDLIRRAQANPGVKEMMEVYGRVQDAYARLSPYVRMTDRPAQQVINRTSANG